MNIDMDEVADFLFDIGFSYGENNQFSCGGSLLSLKFINRDGEDECIVYMKEPLGNSRENIENIFFDSIDDLKSELKRVVLRDIGDYERRFDAWKSTMNTIVEKINNV